MKKSLFVFLVVGLVVAFFIIPDVLLAIEDLAPVGSKVNIISLEHQDEFLKGEPVPKKKATLIEYKLVAWILHDENLKPEGHSSNLPLGYERWEALSIDDCAQNWPGGKTGIPIATPVFRLEDGSTITGDKCWWELADKELQQKQMAILTKRLDKYKEFVLTKQAEHYFKEHPEKLGLSSVEEVELYLKDHPEFLQEMIKEEMSKEKN